MAHGNNRRTFLKGTVAAGVGYWAAGGISPRESRAAIDEISFGCIGVGGKGSSDSADAGRHGKVVAICDVDDSTLKKGKARFKEAVAFNDYRKMLDQVGDKIDAVTVSVPDHTHAIAAAKAMEMGKACFCQKPLTHSIYEARQLGNIARENKVVTQMGNQGTAGNGLRKGAALVQAGAIGTVKEVHVWTNRPVWAQGGDAPAEAPVPEKLHWDLWLSGAADRPYGKGYHPFSWRGYWDFGTGALGDMACHTFNLPFMALNLRNPTSVEAEHSGHNNYSYPKTCQILFQFPEDNGRPAIPVSWYDGGKLPPAELFQGKKIKNSGCLIIGDNGTLLSSNDYGSSYEILNDVENYEEPEVDYVKSPGHFTEFANAIKGGDTPVSNFPDYAGPLSETILLGNLAVYANKKIDWDAKNLVAKNAPEVAEIIKPKYREGYSL